MVPTSSITLLMVHPLKDNKATFSQAVKFQPIRRKQSHFWLLILWFIWYVFSCGNGLIEQVGKVLLESLESKQVHLVTYSVTFQL